MDVDPWVRKGIASSREMARHVGSRVHRSKPFFATTPIAQAILAASRRLPEYTFTAESFPCPKGFVWLEQPICLYEGPLFADPVLMHACQWYVDEQLEDEQGQIPILVDAYLVDPDRPKGVPLCHMNMYLGWTLDERYTADRVRAERQASEETSADQSDEPEVKDIITAVLVRFLASFLSFIEQRITMPVSRPASRATRRRLERHQGQFQPAADAQVIELRRREQHHGSREDSPDSSPSREWHVQWLVSG